ncbi:hypothetical protein Ndes2526B_g00764 [Nannochloris sp. 'desiccata']|nr:hypothetical protein KSW81_004058 [Chlorella desiccata (nom. nud.)]KAH7624565.1 putative DnaJ-like protein subfamily C member 7-like protein [Chlorella desiccata (nom. nud.)]
MLGSNREPEAGTRTSFVEPRVVQDTFFRVPSVPQTNGSSAGQNSGVAFNPGVGLPRSSKRTPRKAPTPFQPAQPQQQQPVSPPLQMKQPFEPPQPQFFVFKAADEQPRRTPGIRKAKARTAATSFSAGTTATSGFAAAGSGQSPKNGIGLDNNEDGMSWSPSHPIETTGPIPQQQQQQKQQAPPVSFLFTSTDKSSSNSRGSPTVGGVAKEFTTRLRVDVEQQQKQPAVNPFAAAAAGLPPTAAPFIFSAGSPQQQAKSAAAGSAGGVEGGRRRRRGTPHHPAAPVFPDAVASGPPSSPAFVFQAKPSPTTQQAKPPSAAATVPGPQQPQQQAEGFISLSQFRGTPGAPLRRRPRTKTQQQQQQQKKQPSATSSPINKTTSSAGGPQPQNLHWNAPASAGALKSGTTAPRQQYQQHDQHPGVTKPAFGATQQQQQKPLSTPEQQAQMAAATADKYRISGNDLFRKQKYEEAYKKYTHALNTLMPYPTVHTQLSLLLSNRAAAALALSRPRQALQDCRMGLHHDRTFLKCATRMATCHCRLGEYSQAQNVLFQVRKGLQIFDSAGLKELKGKEVEVKESMAMMIDMLSALGYSKIQSRITQLIEEEEAGSSRKSTFTTRTSNFSRQGEEEEEEDLTFKFLSSLPAPPHPAPKRASLEDLLQHLQTHGSYFPHSEMFHAAKSETLLRLGRYKEALTAVGQPPYLDVPASQADAPWRTWIRTQIAFYQGQAAQTHQLLDTIDKIVTSSSGGGEASREKQPKSVHPLEDLDSIVPLPTHEDIQSIRTILEKSAELRQAGNKAVKEKRYQAALDAYTEALSSGSLSPALAAILYCNRAAAHQGLENRALAVADCCRAKALHPGYAKAHSRLAALLSELGMYSAAVDELNAAIASHESITPASKAEYQNRLRTAKEAAMPRRTFYGTTMNLPPANHYKVLGLERGCAGDQVRKVYKKLALQLHPDKSTTACRVSFQICGNRSSRGSDLTGPAGETQKRLEDGASWVFKCLGEANETLSAPEKRRELDAELSAWEDGTTSGGGGGRGGFTGFDYGGGGPSYHYSGGNHHRQQQQQHQHSGYSAYGAYYRPHAQPSYSFNRNQYGGGGGGGGGGASGGGGGYRHYW